MSVVGVVLSLLNLFLQYRAITMMNAVSTAESEFMAIKIGSNEWLYFITLGMILIFTISYSIYYKKRRSDNVSSDK